MKCLNKTRTHLTIVYKKTKSFLLKKILFAHAFLHGKDKKWAITTKTYNTTSHICAVILTPLVSLTNAALAIPDFINNIFDNITENYKQCIKETVEEETKNTFKSEKTKKQIAHFAFMKRLNKTRTHLTIVYKKTKSFLLKKILFAHAFLHGKDKKWAITTKMYNTTSHICAVILTPLVSLTYAVLLTPYFIVSFLSPYSRIEDYKQCLKESIKRAYESEEIKKQFTDFKNVQTNAGVEYALVINHRKKAVLRELMRSSRPAIPAQRHHQPTQ
ncbi:MAG: hypothetical protein VYC40_01970 [Pseudomonadota bacterium]|nr:hypothetical protein [Pseudomonadota bacterium]